MRHPGERRTVPVPRPQSRPQDRHAARHHAPRRPQLGGAPPSAVVSLRCSASIPRLASGFNSPTGLGPGAARSGRRGRHCSRGGSPPFRGPVGHSLRVRSGGDRPRRAPPASPSEQSGPRTAVRMHHCARSTRVSTGASRTMGPSLVARAWCNGCTRPFQGLSAGSSPVARFTAPDAGSGSPVRDRPGAQSGDGGSSRRPPRTSRSRRGCSASSDREGRARPARGHYPNIAVERSSRAARTEA